MAISFPASLDSLTNPTTSNPLNSPSHAGQHSDANDAIEALQAKVGANSSAVESSHDYKLSTVTGSNKAETQGNKRTSFQAIPTDTAYPSEKLVKDSLDGKADVVSSQSTASASSITPTGNSKENESYVTALAEALTINAPSGTPANGNTILFRIKDNATPRALTWNAIYTWIGTTKPETTKAGKIIYIAGIYNSASEKWEMTAVVLEE